MCPFYKNTTMERMMERNIQYSDEPDQSVFSFFPFIDNYFAGGEGREEKQYLQKKSVIPESLRNHAEFNPFLSSV